jgi:hypothetical protein
MKKSAALVAVLAIVVTSYAAWRFLHRAADAAEILNRPNLDDTGVSYTWTGGFSLTNCDVHAHFAGNGQARLQVGDDEPIDANISSERYRELLACLAENAFSEIKVKRRWGVYQADIGRTEIRLRDDGRETIVYADEKHFVEDLEHIEPILEQIYSFETEFGQRFDYGPVATTCIPDTREITALIAGSLSVLGCATAVGVIWIGKQRKRSRTTEPAHPPEPAAGPVSNGQP